MQTGAWGTLSLVGCPVRLVLGDSRLGSSVVFFENNPPLLFLGKEKAFLSCLGAEEEKSFGCNPVLERLQGSVYWAMAGLSDLLEGQRLV